MTEDQESSALTSGAERPKIVIAAGEEVEQEKKGQLEIKVYKKRWFMLGLFMLFGALVMGQWIEYSIIANIVGRYYNVSSIAVDWTSMIFMLYYNIFVFPVFYLTEKIGLRWTIIMGSTLCCVGSWIKILSVTPNGYFITLFGQSVVAVSLAVMMQLPGRVAAKWFASNELSTATSLGLFGPQFGTAISFLLPPVIVKNHENVEKIGDDLSFMFWCVAIISTVSLVLNIIFFQEDPPLPPNETRALQKSNRDENKEGFVQPIKRLFTNKSFLILCNAYGLNIGIFNVFGTLFNQLFLLHFENGEEDAGRIGLLFLVFGMIGSITSGIILDKTHKFKEITVTVYFLTLCGQILFAVAIFVEILWIVYVAGIFLGTFMAAYLMLGFEMAAEYTYPESESHSGGILNITNNLYGMVLVLIFEPILENYGDIPVHVIICLALLVGLIMTVMTKDEQRRQDARKAATMYQGLPQDEVNNKSTVDISA